MAHVVNECRRRRQPTKRPPLCGEGRRDCWILMKQNYPKSEHKQPATFKGVSRSEGLLYNVNSLLIISTTRIWVVRDRQLALLTPLLTLFLWPGNTRRQASVPLIRSI